ncbi:MAG: hypothetical protein A4E57_03572 [Syntrophorhabdaceae bacterium PtaU1.Bin034]|jgi:hypothetical protein|nr:MAG: hypothetical protein A4E57_03572 [Syntrophorhabdaceae bacterium PtaU1.Bin034]
MVDQRVYHPQNAVDFYSLRFSVASEKAVAREEYGSGL